LSGFLLATAKVVSMYKCNCDLLSYNSSVRSSLNDFHMFITSSYMHNAEQESTFNKLKHDARTSHTCMGTCTPSSQFACTCAQLFFVLMSLLLLVCFSLGA